MPDQTPTDATRVPPGKKRCPNCQALNGVRLRACACGFTFEVKKKETAAAPKAGRKVKGEDDPLLARARKTSEAVADFCAAYDDIATVTEKLTAVQALHGKLTAEEHRQIENLAAATGGLDILLLVAREVMNRPVEVPVEEESETDGGEADADAPSEEDETRNDEPPF